MIDISSLLEKEMETVVEKEMCIKCGGKLSLDLASQERIEYCCESCSAMYILLLNERLEKAYPSESYESREYSAYPADRTFVLL